VGQVRRPFRGKAGLGPLVWRLTCGAHVSMLRACQS
jgi:hypothetical protein